MKKTKVFLIIVYLLVIPSLSYLEEITNYSREMQQAITLYREGKNPDAMDKFMDILVNGTPEEKALANEYISKITQGIKYNEDTNKASKMLSLPSSLSSSNSKSTLSNTTSNQKQDDLKDKDNSESNLDISINVSKKIEEMKRTFLYSLSRKNFLKIYMDDSNNNPNYILIKEDKVFNEDITFNEKIIEDINQLAGLITIIGKTVITVIPNGSLNGNMKISNIRKATALHSFFTSYGISPSKIKLDVIGNSVSVSKKVDDTNGIILAFDYSKEPELKISQEKPQVSISLYPSKINPFNNESVIIEFSVIEGLNPLSSWKLLLNKIEKGQKTIIQKIESTQPILNQIYFNGREKTVGAYYPEGEYEFFLEASDIKGNNVSVKKGFYIVGSNQAFTLKEKSKETSKLDNKKNNTSKKSSNKLDSKDLNTNTKNFWKIYFESETLDITDKSKKSIEELVIRYKELKKDPKLKIYITGFASLKEKDAKKVALKRANAVKNYLIKQYNVNPKRFVVKSQVVKINKRVVEVVLK